ncbi:amino acid ABC transporter ATP-binding protein [Sphingobium sp. H39-3-25]|uniref:amino acid ABC transporter ATP-binding protein n=1 Tax=Sphingobium arseniciresistens TaxID=3030834 RepID=UPI0023B91907|nr:amino acid ABC transporter ATP-binding protein [Sphingobium arseniciresistens]
MIGLHKSFGSLEVIKGIDLDVQKGERIAIIGGSGSGKSTFLRCINHMETPTSGRIVVDGVVYEHPVPPRDLRSLRQRVGMVFQQFNLFPHMTVLENVAEALIQVKGMKRVEAETIAMAELEKVGMAAKAPIHPTRLSGGQQQRVAIARALAMKPEIMLFDEPTSALDPELVSEVLSVIRSLADENRTILLVTHELGFAYHFATRILFIADGRIYEQGTPDEVLKAPKLPRTMAFLERFTEFKF